jgi:putative restriction endonuclease
MMNYIVNIADIEKALLSLGGEARAKEIQDKILADQCEGVIPGNYQSERSFRQTIQRKIEDYCPDAEGFDKSKKEAKFLRVSHGRYRVASGVVRKGVRFFWVNVGQTYDEVINEEYLWAPQFGEYLIDPDNPDGGVKKRYFEHWTNVGDVRAGDIIFGNFDRRILFVAVATADAKPSRRPTTRTFKQWNDLGFKVDIQIFPLAAQLPVDGDIKDGFDRRYNRLCTPKVFKSSGEVFQGYMAALPDAAGVEMLRLAGDVEVSAIEISDGIRESHQGAPNKHRKPAGETTKKSIRDARIGQGYFRHELLKMWKGCPITGITNTNLLLASHSKPWSKSNDDERLDPYNGFLFAPNVDRPFDKGLISFDDEGRIIISDLLSDRDQKALGLHQGISIKLHPNHLKYLAAHREIFGL